MDPANCQLLFALLCEAYFYVRALGQVDAFHKANLAAVARHHDRRRTITFAEETDAFHQRAIGDAGSGKNNVVSRGKVFGGVDFSLVLDAHFLDAGLKFRCIDNQAREDFTVQATHGSRSNYALRSAEIGR